MVNCYKNGEIVTSFGGINEASFTTDTASFSNEEASTEEQVAKLKLAVDDINNTILELIGGM